MPEQERLSPAELLARRLAATPAAQLDALERAIEGCKDYAAALMEWMRELVRWEFARRSARPVPATLPKLAAADAATAALTLTVLAAIFQSSVDAGALGLQPTVDLLDAIRQLLAAHVDGDGGSVH